MSSIKNINDITDTTAEAGCIATLMYHPEFLLSIDYLKAGYFQDKFNGCLYWAIDNLYKAGVDNIDVVNLENMINSNSSVKKVFEEYGDSLSDFIEAAKYAARNTIEEYKLLAKEVLTCAYKRDLYRTTSGIQSMCFDDKVDLSKLNIELNTQINKVTEKYLISDEIRTIGEDVDVMWESLVESRGDDGVVGLPSKFNLLNNYFTYEEGELVLLCARMKRGKSMWMMNEAIHKLKNGVSVLYIDTEMTTKSHYLRMLSNLTGISYNDIKAGRYDKNGEDKIKAANKWLKSVNYVHKYMPVINYDEIHALCKILKYKFNLGFVIFDYIKPTTGLGASEVSNLLGYATNYLKNNIAGDLELPVLAGAQLSRDMQVALSDQINRYCSTSVTWREKTAEEIQNDGGLDAGNFCAQVTINRNGKMHGEDEYINFKFDGDHCNIVEAKVQHSVKNPFEDGE